MRGRMVDDIEEEELVEGRPVVKVVPDTDLLVLPPTADSLEEALRDGGCSHNSLPMVRSQD